MNDNLLENLLYQEESESLDFKRDQYKFKKATDDSKSELLKDILAFANSWRNSDAYILIGVDEIKGGKSKVLGIEKHLLNRNLQQFVDSKVNKPLKFSYSPFEYNNNEIGVIEIPQQERPFYLEEAYGKLDAKKVYIRRGDTTSSADPEEIAKMGKSFDSKSVKEPVLNLQFADLDTRELLDTNLQVDCNKLVLNDISSIPDYGEKRGRGLGSATIVNDDYFRDIARYLAKTNHLFEYGLFIKNNSNVLAENVLVTIAIENKNGLTLFDEEQFPAEPSAHFMPNVNLKKSLEGRPIPSIDVNKHGNNWHLESNFGNIQPGAEVWSKESFFIGAVRSYEAELKTKIVANNLKKPISMQLNISFETTNRELESNDIDAFRRIIES